MLVYGATGKGGPSCGGARAHARLGGDSLCPQPSQGTRGAANSGDRREGRSLRRGFGLGCRPNAIVDASSALPFGRGKGQPANNADRAVIIKATAEALAADGREKDCVLLIIGGQLLPEPGGKINSGSIAALAWVLRTFVARKEWREMERMLRWCFEDTPSAFRFVYARMGQMVESPSRGRLRAEATLNNIQHGSVSYVDVAEALVQLAGDEARTCERKALFFHYENAKTI